MTLSWFLTIILVKCQIFSQTEQKATIEDPRWASGGGVDKEEGEDLKDKPQCAPIQGSTGGEQCLLLLLKSSSGSSWELGGGNGGQERPVKAQMANQQEMASLNLCRIL